MYYSLQEQQCTYAGAGCCSHILCSRIALSGGTMIGSMQMSGMAILSLAKPGRNEV